MSITQLPEWDALIRPYVKIEYYGRDGGPVKPRFRIEMGLPPAPVVAVWLGLRTACVDCGALVAPLRARKGANKRGAPRGFYYAPSCPLSVNVACSRSRAAHEEYERVRSVVEGP